MKKNRILIAILCMLLIFAAACTKTEAEPSVSGAADPVKTEQPVKEDALAGVRSEYIKKINALSLDGATEEKLGIIKGITRRAKSDIELAESEEEMARIYEELVERIAVYTGKPPAVLIATADPENPEAPDTPGDSSGDGSGTGGSGHSGSGGNSGGSGGSGYSGGSPGSSHTHNFGDWGEGDPWGVKWRYCSCGACESWQGRWVVTKPAKDEWYEDDPTEVPITKYVWLVWYTDGTEKEFDDETSAFLEYSSGNTAVAGWGGPYPRIIGYETVIYHIYHPAEPEEGYWVWE